MLNYICSICPELPYTYSFFENCLIILNIFTDFTYFLVILIIFTYLKLNQLFVLNVILIAMYVFLSVYINKIYFPLNIPT